MAVRRPTRAARDATRASLPAHSPLSRGYERRRRDLRRARKPPYDLSRDSALARDECPAGRYRRRQHASVSVGLDCPARTVHHQDILKIGPDEVAEGTWITKHVVLHPTLSS